MEVRILSEGNVRFSGRVANAALSKFREVTHYLEIFRQAREIARHFGIDPVVPAGLNKSQLEDIEDMYWRVMPGQRERKGVNFRNTFTFDPDTLSKVVEDLEQNQALSLPFEMRAEVEEFELFGTKFDAGPATYLFPNPAIETPAADLRALIANSKSGEHLPVPAVCDVVIVKR